MITRELLDYYKPFFVSSLTREVGVDSLLVLSQMYSKASHFETDAKIAQSFVNDLMKIR